MPEAIGSWLFGCSIKRVGAAENHFCAQAAAVGINQLLESEKARLNSDTR
jgi:hypothetical protein